MLLILQIVKFKMWRYSSSLVLGNFNSQGSRCEALRKIRTDYWPGSGVDCVGCHWRDLSYPQIVSSTTLLKHWDPYSRRKKTWFSQTVSLLNSFHQGNPGEDRFQLQTSHPLGWRCQEDIWNGQEESSSLQRASHIHTKVVSHLKSVDATRVDLLLIPLVIFFQEC